MGRIITDLCVFLCVFLNFLKCLYLTSTFTFVFQRSPAEICKMAHLYLFRTVSNKKPRPEKWEEGQSYPTSSSYDVRYCPLHLWALFTHLWNNVWLFGSGDPCLCCHYGEFPFIIIKTAPFLEPMQRCWYVHALTCGILHRRTLSLRVTKGLTQGCTVRKRSSRLRMGLSNCRHNHLL